MDGIDCVGFGGWDWVMQCSAMECNGQPPEEEERRGRGGDPTEWRLADNERRISARWMSGICRRLCILSPRGVSIHPHMDNSLFSFLAWCFCFCFFLGASPTSRSPTRAVPTQQCTRVSHEGFGRTSIRPTCPHICGQTAVLAGRLAGWCGGHCAGWTGCTAPNWTGRDDGRNRRCDDGPPEHPARHTTVALALLGG